MTIATYTDLQTAIGAFLDHSIFASQYSTFIQFFESTANRRLRTPYQEARTILIPSNPPTVAVSNAVNNGSGLIRLTVASTPTYATNQAVIVANVSGTTEANGEWLVTVIDGATLDLQGSTFTNAYVASSGTVQALAGEVALPSDYLAHRRVTWTGQLRRELDEVHPSYFQASYPSRPSDVPAFFTIEDSTLKVMPINSTPLEFEYFQKIPALASNATNWLLTSHPDLYLFGSMVEAEVFGANDERMPLWKARRDELFDEVDKLGQKRKGCTLHPSPACGGGWPRSISAFTRVFDALCAAGWGRSTTREAVPPGASRHPPPFGGGIRERQMPLIPFLDYKPDISPYQTGGGSTVITNVLPRADGYGPMLSLVGFTSALAAACRGFFYARNSDASITVFAATSTNLYKLNNTTFAWTNVSKGGGPYSGLPSADNWQFVQFDNFVIAVNINTVPQVFDLTSSTAFADLGGSPPQARYIAVVGRFLVLSGLGSSTPYRIQWSGLNATTTWTSGVNSSDFQDLPDGGIVRGVAGGEYGYIFQETSIRRMVYAPGSPVTFNIERIAQDKGLAAPYSLINAGDRVFFLAPQGFHMIVPGTPPAPIGKERFDRTFFGDYDSGSLQLVIGCADPAATRVYWAYKSLAGQANLFDKIIVYDYALDRAALLLVSGEYLASLAKPGLTLENLDSIASGIISITNAANNGSGAIRLTLASETASWTYGQADTTHSAGQAGTTTLGATQPTIEVYGVTGTTEANGNWAYTIIDSTHIDLVGSTFTNAYVSGGSIGGALDSLTFSLDDISTNALTKLSAVNSSHVVGFFSGTSLAATIETAEQALDGGRRTRVKGFRPVTDAGACSGAVGGRENVQSSVTYSTPQAVNSKGLCPANVSTRLARAQVTVPAGTVWTFASGVEPFFAQEGGR
jgi:hypothetical protein